MASTPRGRQLTEDHRLAQVANRNAFLAEFLALWPLLNPEQIQKTGPGWIRAVMPLIEDYRERSAQLAEDYYVDFRAAEAPEASLDGPAPKVDRQKPSQARSPARRTRNPRLRQVGRGRLVTPKIIWDDDNRAAQTSLIVTGPANIESKKRRGKSPEQAAREAVVEAGGSAARHVLTGGRTQHLEMIREDPAKPAWIRVTDGDPCAFCAMLASRGPVYQSKWTATHVVQKTAKRPPGAIYHDNCGCTAEAVFTETQAWPGRGREFQKLWYEATNGMSGKDAINAFRRAYERPDVWKRKQDERREQTA
jgi:hypothetical protein